MSGRMGVTEAKDVEVMVGNGWKGLEDHDEVQATNHLAMVLLYPLSYRTGVLAGFEPATRGVAGAFVDKERAVTKGCKRCHPFPGRIRTIDAVYSCGHSPREKTSHDESRMMLPFGVAECSIR